MKYEILTKNYENFKHPKTGLPIKLFRIIALVDFEFKSPDGYVIHIKKGQLGGLIQAEKNLSQNDSSWIANSAKLFDNATISNSLIRDEAWVFGNVQVADSIVSRKTHIFDSVKIVKSYIDDNVDISGTSYIANSKVVNSCKIVGSSNIDNCEMFGGSRVSDSKVSWSKMYDQAEVRKGSVVENCVLKGRSVVVGEMLKNEVRETNIELNVLTGNN